MSTANRVKRLEAAHAPANIMRLTDGEPTGYDITLLTDAELEALIGCFDEQGTLVADRITPGLEAALERVRR